MHSTFRKVTKTATVASSRLAETLSSSVSWRDEIDNYREAEKWDDALDMYKRLGKDKDHGMEVLVLGQKCFYEDNTDEARKHWQSLINNANPTDFAHLEAHALLGMLETKEKNIDEATKHFDIVFNFLEKLDDSTLRENLITSYRFSVLTEALLCRAKTEGPLEASYTYESISDATLKYHKIRGMICEKARRHYEEAVFQRTLLTYDNEGERSALRGWREALSSQIKASPPHQNELLKKISETCLYYFRCTPHYPEPEKGTGDHFVPSSAAEEAVLASLLLQNESQDDIKVYDDLLFCLGTQNALSYSISSMEKAVALHSQNEHLWTQFMLCLLTGGKEKQAFTVIQQILEVNPKNVMMLLFGAQICINHLNDISKAAEYCSTAITVCNNEPKRAPFLGRSYHYMGVCYSALAPGVFSVERKDIHAKALECFQQATISGCNNYLFLFHHALEHAETRNIVAAKSLIQRSLTLNEDYAPSWILLVLLLTSQKLYSEAAEICNVALTHHEDVRLYYCSAKIDLHMKRYPQALATLNSMCKLLAGTTTENSAPEMNIPSDTLFSPRGKTDDQSESRTSVSQMSDTSSLKILDSSAPKRQNIGAFDSWILLAQVFIELGQYQDTASCLVQADSLVPFHPDTYYWRGKLAEARNHRSEAIARYKEALGCDSNHELSILQLAQLSLGNDIHESENYATTAVRKFPFSDRGWFLLGQVLVKFEDPLAAGSCMKLALDLEATTPLIPFSWIKREIA